MTAPPRRRRTNMSVMQDLKTFLTQSTFVTLAVAFVVGTQVGLVVTALVSSVIDPAIGVVFKSNFSQVGLVTVNGSTFTFGALLGAVINFVIVLLVVFFVIVYPFAQYQKRQAAKTAPTTTTCPFCCSTINVKATRCAFCTATLPAPAPTAAAPTPGATSS
jgi:large conductance mechanosensitive channel